MKTGFLLLSFLLLTQLTGWSQDLIWNNYPDGSLTHTFPNVGNPAVNLGVNVSGSTSSLNPREPNGRPLGLRLSADFPTAGNCVSVEITFSQAVSNLNFNLIDIDYTDGDSRYQDVVTVTGSNAGASVTPSIGTASTNTVSGNTVTGQNSNAAQATNTVTFTSPVTQITIQYCAGPAFIDPETQEIYIGNFNWDAVVLPVRLVSFGGQSAENQVQLGWQTTYESNSDYFAIERSRDAQSFEAIGRVTSKGFSESLQQYGFADARPLSGLNYYRLRQVDRDGTFAYSKIIAVAYEADGFYFQVLPQESGGVEVRTNAVGPVFRLVDLKGISSLGGVEQLSAHRYLLHVRPSGQPGLQMRVVQMQTPTVSHVKKILLQ